MTRFSKPEKAPTYMLHEGAIGVFGAEGLTEPIQEPSRTRRPQRPGKSADGWLGITDKYWAARSSREDGTFQPRYSFFDNGRTRWQADYLAVPMTVDAGERRRFENLFFAGAKEVPVYRRLRGQTTISSISTC